MTKPRSTSRSVGTQSKKQTTRPSVNQHAAALLAAIQTRKLIPLDDVPEGYVSVDEIIGSTPMNPKEIKVRLYELHKAGKADRLWVKEQGHRPRYYYKLK